MEKFVPATPGIDRWFVLVLLAIFFVSVLAGIFIFSAATAAQHNDNARAKRQIDRIESAAYIHIVFLVIGVLILGGKLVGQVFTEVPESPAVHCVPEDTES